MANWRTAAVVLALAVGVAACGGGSDDAGQSTTSRATSSSSTSTTEEETSVTVGIICTSAEDAAGSVVSAWTAGDRAAALRCASDTAVEQLFATDGAGNTWIEQGCDRTDPTVPVCAYSYEGGAAFLTVEGSDADGWKVTQVEFVAD